MTMAQLLGTSIDDLLVSTGENDSIWGGTGGTDTAQFSGASVDYEITANGDGSYYVRDLREGAPDGVDKVRSIELFAFSDVTLSLEAFLAAMPNEIVGTDGDDTLLGTDGDDIFLSGAGDDAIWGGMAGEDRIVYAGNIADYAIAASDNGAYYVYDRRDGQPDGVDKVRSIELFQFADGTLTLAEFIEASRDPDMTLTGTEGADTLLGKDGDDTFIPLGGEDRVWGGEEGHDTIVLSGRFDDYVVTDNMNGSLTLVDLRASGDGVNVVRSIESFVFADGVVGLDAVFDGTGSQLGVTTRVLIGTNGDDTISAAHTDDLFGAYTNDEILGGAGNDRLLGGPGDDTIFGDFGPDGAPQAEFAETPETDLDRFAPGAGYFAIDGTVLSRIDPATGEVETIGTLDVAVDAVGLNPLDGYAYGFVTSGRLNGHLIRIGADGGTEDLGKTLKNASIGDFHESGGFLVATGGNDLLNVDVRTGEVTTLHFDGDSKRAAQDIAFLGDFGYGLSNNGELAIWDLSSLTLDSVKVSGIVNKGHFDAIWASADGTLLAHQEKTGTIYRIDGLDSGAPFAIALADAEAGGTGFSFGTAGPQPLSAGGDRLEGGDGRDALFGEDGDDVVDGGSGADLLDGGAGFDVLSYRSAESGVTVDLERGIGLSGDAEGDRFSNFEEVLGSYHGDTFFGSAGNDRIAASDGDDLFHASAGEDRLWGGLGEDTILFIGAVAEYAVRRVGDPGQTLDDRYEDEFFYEVTSLATGDTTRIRDIEHIQFDNVSIDTDSGSWLPFT